MKKISLLLVFCAGILWGSMGLFVRTLTEAGFTSMQISFLRAVLTTVLFAVAMLLFDRSLFRVRLKDLWCFLGTGVASITFFNYCYFTAIKETSLSVAAVLLYTAPIFVLSMSAAFFHETISRRKLYALALCAFGCLLVSGVLFEGHFTLLGTLAGLGAGFGYALYSVFSRLALDRGYRTLTILFYTFLFSAVATAFFVPLRGTATLMLDEPRLWLWVVMLAIVVTVAPYLLYTLGLRNTETGTASIVASVEPVFATLLGLVVYREIPTVFEAVGIVLVLTAILLLNRKEEAA